MSPHRRMTKKIMLIWRVKMEHGQVMKLSISIKFVDSFMRYYNREVEQYGYGVTFLSEDPHELCDRLK